MADIPIWPGSGSAISGSTPFGQYDTDSSFQSDGPNLANWCAKRLGYPITDVELQDSQFYACFEESISEYSAQVNQFQIRENLLNVKGAPTGSDMTNVEINPNPLARAISIAENYGSEVGSGGNVTWRSGSIDVIANQQDYDLDAWATVSASGESIEIKRIFHEAPPAIQRYFDPFVGTGMGMNSMLDSFGFGNYSPGVSFMLMPIYADILRLQAIEFSDQIRKSAYSFELINNNLRIFPIPADNGNGISPTKIHFQYIHKADRNAVVTNNVGTVTNYSNIPYNNFTYSFINDVGKQWIRKYALALSRELLGFIRSKYSSVPVPGSEVTLNGGELVSQAQQEKEELVTQLRENLEQSSRRLQLEAQREENENMLSVLSGAPLKIYIG
jgi:hypothetical protein|tara:strand:+ start:39 stop:1199 length:1161 start_codon:yes stop_codon:yes gene_type:complete